MNSRTIVFAALLSLIGCTIAAGQTLTIRDVGESLQKDSAEIRGLSAGAFNPKLWQGGKLHLVRDGRMPLIDAKKGDFRNIYAPSVVPTDHGWTVFYGGWDGTPSGNDRIYRGDVDADFLDITNRHTVIEHNVFQHTCNVNLTRDENGAWAMMATAYPDSAGQNKPITFFSKDGEHWNGDAVPHNAIADELATVAGYANYAKADVNGVNVLLRDDNRWRMYFADFKNFGKTFRASSEDGRHFTLDGDVLDGFVAINDMKKIKLANGETWYLAGFHMNGDRLYYSLSQDGMKFPPVQTLIAHAGDADRYIVAIGLVVRDDRVLGALYGAGAAGSLDHNRIFAVWLQKKVTIESAGQTLEMSSAWGSDRQLLKLAAPIHGRLHLLSEDGETPIADTDVDLKPGRAYELR